MTKAMRPPMPYRPFLAVLAFTASCSDTPSDLRPCQTNADCVQNAAPGECLPSPSSPNSWCAFPVTMSECPSGQKWGLLAGDGLANQCVNTETTDGGVLDGPVSDGGAADGAVDASVPDANLSTPDGSPADAAGPSTLTEQIVVGASSDDVLWRYDAATLAFLGSITLPDRAGAGNNALFVHGGAIWITSLSDVTAVDISTLMLRAGYPQTITDCNIARAFIDGSELYCPLDMTGTSSDRVKRFAGPPYTFSSEVMIADPAQPIVGSSSRVLVPHGAPTTNLAVLDPMLSPVAGSPIVPGAAFSTTVAISDSLNRIAIGQSSTIDVFDRATLAPVMEITGSSSVGSIAFDETRGWMLAARNNGTVTGYDAADLAVTVPAVTVASGAISDLYYDATRDRIYALNAGGGSMPILIVLDAATLNHVTGSPIVLPAVGGALVGF